MSRYDDLSDDVRADSSVFADKSVLDPLAEPDVPAETERTVIDEGDGWKAVVSSDRVITNMVLRRGDAETNGFEILGPVELPLADATEYDLVEVDADPDDDRHPNRPDI